MVNDATLLTDCLRAAADELEDAHRFLDKAGVPRANPRTGREMSLTGRISLYRKPA